MIDLLGSGQGYVVDLAAASKQTRHNRESELNEIAHLMARLEY
jgi:hypothetical protein